MADMKLSRYDAEPVAADDDAGTGDLEQVFTEALRQYEDAVDADRHNQEQAREDAGFLQGRGQWDSKVEAERKAEGRPTLTVNHMKPFVRQVANEIRMNPPAIRVTASEDGDAKTAEVYEGLIRAIERNSAAKRVYSAAASSAAGCGMGYWRIDTEYEDDDFNQTIRIRLIKNPYCVYFDPCAEELTKGDAEFGFVSTEYSKARFEAIYGKDDLSDFPIALQSKVWSNGDKVTMAEYFRVTKAEDTLLLLEDGSTVRLSDMANIQAAAARGLRVMADRPCHRKVVTQYMLSGRGVIGKPKKTPFDRVPVIPCYGEEYFDGEKYWRNGVITDAKDLQRMVNYWQSAAVERIALSPKAPWLVTPKQIAGYEQEWRVAATGNPPFLPYTPDEKAPGAPQRIAPAPIEAGMLQQAQIAVDGIKNVTGIHDASLGARSNETSGRAILARQKEGDVGTYVFVDNTLAAIEETGRVICQLIPQLFDIPRRIRILGKKMEPKIVEVNNGEIDLARGKYDVAVGTGQSLGSQRQESAALLLDAIQAAPQFAPVLIPRLIAVLELPDSEEIVAEIMAMINKPPANPNPKDLAQAEKYSAEAEGQRISNSAEQFSLGHIMGTAAATGTGQRQQETPPSPAGSGANPPQMA